MMIDNHVINANKFLYYKNGRALFIFDFKNGCKVVAIKFSNIMQQQINAINVQVQRKKSQAFRALQPIKKKAIPIDL
jgi:hypothetical protein